MRSGSFDVEIDVDVRDEPTIVDDVPAVTRTVVPDELLATARRLLADEPPPAPIGLSRTSWVLVAWWCGVAAAVLTVVVLDSLELTGARVTGFFGLVAGIVAGGWVLLDRVPIGAGRGVAVLAPVVATTALSGFVATGAGRALSLLGHDHLYHFTAMRSFLVAGPVHASVGDVPAGMHRTMARLGSLAVPCTGTSTRCQILWYFHVENLLAGLAVATVFALGHELVRGRASGRTASRAVGTWRAVGFGTVGVAAVLGWFGWLWWLGSWPFLVAIGVVAAVLLVLHDARRRGAPAPAAVGLLLGLIVFAWPLLVVVSAALAVLLLLARRSGRSGRPSLAVLAALVLPTGIAVLRATERQRTGRGLASLSSPWPSGLGTPELRLLVLVGLVVGALVVTARRRAEAWRAWWDDVAPLVLVAVLTVVVGLGLELVVELFGEGRGDYYGGKVGVPAFVLLVLAALASTGVERPAGSGRRRPFVRRASAPVLVALLAVAMLWVSFPRGVPVYAVPLVGSGDGGIALAPAVRPVVRAVREPSRGPVDGPMVLAAADALRDCPGAGPSRLPLPWDGAPRTEGTEQYAMYWVAALTGRADWWEMARRINVPYDAGDLAAAAATHRVSIVALSDARTETVTTGGFTLAPAATAFELLCS